VTRAVGIDVGGTKIAAGLVDVEGGRLLAREEVPTRPERGGPGVLSDCAELADALGEGAVPVGIGLCELVGLDGRPASADTVDWRDLDLAGVVGAPRVMLVSDVMAAARAEARFGAGAMRSPFLFVVVGTGASACLVVDGEPYVGSRGFALVLGAPPVETIASGAALARRAGVDRAEDVFADRDLAWLVDEAAGVLGQALAVLVNALDPELVVLGGGLGCEPRFQQRVAAAVSPLIAYPRAAPLEIVGSALGSDAGIVGAALAVSAADGR
jgi:predicted NBD/HSP70 family sugar kinase